MDNLLEQDTISFKAEGRLLQELGLRLVASPEVAMVELIKNAYDADSESCTVSLEKHGSIPSLVINDNGHGMTLDEFKNSWMKIATSSKLDSETSRRYRRRLTGAKGIGRFAVRYLGDHLVLTTVATDEKRKSRTSLKAIFDWQKLDKLDDISNIEVEYELRKVGEDVEEGTTLRITKLRDEADFVVSGNLRSEILKMVSPIQGLSRGSFAAKGNGATTDPGFQVNLPGDPEDDETFNLAENVLKNCWARLTIKLSKRYLDYSVSFDPDRKPKKLRVPVKTSISNGFYADIRFFPRRGGIFSKKGFNGKKAWEWVRDNCGVAVVDHGFRIQPYGFEKDDWLNLDFHAARNLRDWVTTIAQEYFPIPPAIKSAPADNPALNLATNFQLVGAVFVETKRSSSDRVENDLIPSMDRQGLFENDGATQLRDYVRAGLEFLAKEDKAELDRIAAVEARKAARTAREDIQKAIEHIESSETLTKPDKNRIVKQYRSLADQVDRQEEYSAQARRSLISMSLLGVLAGFMTHESKAAVNELRDAVNQVKELSQKHASLKLKADNLASNLNNFEGYLEYSRMFIRGARSSEAKEFSSAAQVRLVIKQFESFIDQRKITVCNDVARDVQTPPMPIAVYSGILLNLFTNAIKAVLTTKAGSAPPKILFRGWNEGQTHIIQVCDNGPGIPIEMKNRIWDPLYTTTSDVANPLGSGMGLGLTLVKQVVNEFNGKINLHIPAPPDYTTCFRVAFPFPKK